MDDKKLRYFAAVAECGSFTRASAQLRIAQPALSRQVALLEKEFGVQLFLRMGHHVVLTEAGEVLLRHAQAINAALQRARDEMESRGRSPRGRVTIGAPPSLGTVIVPGLFQRLRAGAPEIELRVLEGTSAFLERSILEGNLDLALVAEDPSSQWIDGWLLAREAVTLIGSAPVMAGGATSIRELAADLPILSPGPVRALALPILQREKVVCPEIVAMDAIHAIHRMVVAGNALTISPIGLYGADLAAGKVRAAQLEGLGIERPIILAQSNARPHSRATSLVVDALAEEIGDLHALELFSLPAGSIPLRTD